MKKHKLIKDRFDVNHFYINEVLDFVKARKKVGTKKKKGDKPKNS